jgi:ActR/RegA family two-component response regulator/anti-sigma regulatory factor (Ser/Thr protein kinase)
VLALPNENGPYARIAELTLERVLSNVIGNAVRYAQRSEIRIEVLRDSMKRVAIRVTDGGPGIPIDVIDRVNHADVHGESLVGTQGWGVGLVSCKAMLVTAGGDMKIAASSEGSVVDICVPEVAAVAIPRTNSRVESGPTTRESVALDTRHHVAAPRMDRGPAVDLAPAEGEHALFIIDDDVEHSASLERLLLKSGLCMRLFSTIEAAVQEMSVSMPGWILCDAHMPDGGAERLLQILATSRQAFRCAVMSGETDDDLLYRCAALGAREFFQKPLDIERLVAWASNGMNPPRTVASVAG